MTSHDQPDPALKRMLIGRVTVTSMADNLFVVHKAQGSFE
jgi:hypothetical protein